jgi:hypothetical protein
MVKQASPGEAKKYFSPVAKDENARQFGGCFRLINVNGWRDGKISGFPAIFVDMKTGKATKLLGVEPYTPKRAVPMLPRRAAVYKKLRILLVRAIACPHGIVVALFCGTTVFFWSELRKTRYT